METLAAALDLALVPRDGEDVVDAIVRTAEDVRFPDDTWISIHVGHPEIGPDAHFDIRLCVIRASLQCCGPSSLRAALLRIAAQVSPKVKA